MAVVAFIVPKRMPNPPPGPPWVGRLLAAAILVFVGFSSKSALDEARERPDCRIVSSAAE